MTDWQDKYNAAEREIIILKARALEQETAVDLYKVRLDMMDSALKRLKEILDDPPWNKL